LKKFHTKKIHHLLLTKYYYGDQIKVNELGGARGKYGENGNAYTLLVGNPEGKSPLGSLREDRAILN